MWDRNHPLSKRFDQLNKTPNVHSGVEELNDAKLKLLLVLKYKAIDDAKERTWRYCYYKEYIYWILGVFVWKEAGVREGREDDLKRQFVI